MTAYNYPIEFRVPPSQQQHDIFSAIMHLTCSMVIKATAGAGKTTTLVNITRLLTAGGTSPRDILFVAFNRSIVEELKERLPRGVAAMTLHGVGNRILRERLPVAPGKPDGFKYGNLIREYLIDAGLKPRVHKDFRLIADSARDLTNAVRLGGLDYSGDSREALEMYLDETQDEYPKAYVGQIVGATLYALNSGLKQAQQGNIDYTDMLWVPYVLSLTPSTRFDFVMVDESQDLNGLQRWLVQRCLRPKGRLLAVGDPNQAIYGFAGATPNSMNLLRDELQAEEFPLSVTYRCPALHVALAQVVVGEASIQAAPNAPRGVLSEMGETDFRRTVQYGDVVLGRTNRPLIACAFDLIRAGRRVRIRGKEIGASLIKLAETLGENLSPFTSEAFSASLDAYYDTQRLELMTREDLTEARIEQKIGELEDRVEALRAISQGSRASSVLDLKTAIERLFSDDEAGEYILLSSIHKAKGLEFDNVFIIEGENMPPAFSQKTEADRAGENCVMFVALTRAKKALHFVGGVPGHLRPAFDRLTNPPTVLH